MINLTKNIFLKSIGKISSSFTKHSGNKNEIIADIILEKKYVKALRGIEDYSHIIVLFWLDKITYDEKKQLAIHPRGNDKIPKTGIFSTRSKTRPNPIGLTVVKLISRKKNILKVKGLDAFDGSFVLDIKTYDHKDIKINIHVPKWWSNLNKNKK
jgi:tRNA-Thr(GGU) m(6)t(6)A37 methyltransferase TsaA